MRTMAPQASTRHWMGRRMIAIPIVIVAALATATTAAIAAHPKRGAHFAGFSDLTAISGFRAPVSFSVSSSGASLLNFKFSSLGCFGAGGFRPGVDYYTKPEAIIKIGTVKVSKSGRFSATGAVSSHTAFGITTKTTAGVNGTFTSAKTATGTINFSQQDTGKYTSSCGPASITFTAKGR